MKYFYIGFIVLICSITTLLGQLEKGDWMLESFNNTAIRQVDGGGFSIPFMTKQFSNTIGRMITDRTMFGINIDIQESKFSMFFIPDQSLNYSLGVFIRQYFNKKGRFLPFIELQSSFEQHKSVGFFLYNDEEVFNTNLGLGIVQFIAPNIGVEAILKTKVIGEKLENNTQSNSAQIYLGLGLKTFLKDRFIEKIDLRDDYLKAGNFSIGGSGMLENADANEIGLFFQNNLTDFDSKQGVHLNFSPKISYFKNDYWLILFFTLI